MTFDPRKPVYTQRIAASLPGYKNTIKNIQKNIAKLEEQKDLIETIIRDIEHITEFYDEIALCINQPYNETETSVVGTFIQTVPAGQRCAEVRHIIDEPKNVDKWGIYLYNFNDPDEIGRRKWLGDNFRKEEAMKIGKEWVAKGIRPWSTT